VQLLVLLPLQLVPMWPTDWYVDRLRDLVSMNNHNDFFPLGVRDMDLEWGAGEQEKLKRGSVKLRSSL
jgi:hypothetical protein